ncbi:hypothetical protein F5X96DRAFT_615769 [Biscogniauxia mediterranea]|nr:hypothetical protein F5X96DRAFT_615769 [Biscogniauxia mediterranea]
MCLGSDIYTALMSLAGGVGNGCGWAGMMFGVELSSISLSFFYIFLYFYILLSHVFSLTITCVRANSSVGWVVMYREGIVSRATSR